MARDLSSSSSPGSTGGRKPSSGDIQGRLGPPVQPEAALGPACGRSPRADRGMTTWGLAAAAALVATPALAHEGHHEQMPLMQALRHLVSQPDHQIAFAALVVLAVVGGWGWRRAKARK